MAGANECFNIGSIVRCKTCFNDELEGEVIAYDPAINTILLKTNSSSGRSSACDVLFINLHYASEVKVIREATTTQLPPLPSLNLAKINDRMKKSIDDKSKLLHALQSGGTVDGQKLFLTINKTIDDITWSGPNIIVLKQVLISPPYTLDSVREYKEGKEGNAKAVGHVRKIVEKFYKDQQPTVNSATSSNSLVTAAATNGSPPPSRRFNH